LTWTKKSLLLLDPEVSFAKPNLQPAAQP